ncbi:MAG TPA: succinate dehydrogenase cytochrome b558 subunit [Gemmatimonadota bacterium]|nr:succinate dehydrogenase cytochrome b558 subunit [Gemmatimonadota bacterium]
MPTIADTHSAEVALTRRQFFLRRLHSLTGIVPIGLYVLFHLGVNAFAASGPETYDQIAEFLESLPYLLAIEIPFIWLPILYHAGYGIYIHATGRPNPFQYAYRSNWLYWLQRWSGIVTLVFIGWHFWQTRLANYIYGRVIEFQMMADILSDPRWLAFYVVGLIAVSYHLANGLRSFLLTWGAVVGDRARRRTAVISAVFGVLVLVFSLATIGAFLR